jgi:hypothetical protein
MISCSQFGQIISNNVELTVCYKLCVVVARLFLHAEQESLHLKCPMFQEHLTEAIHCFNQAIKVFSFLFCTLYLMTNSFILKKIHFF